MACGSLRPHPFSGNDAMKPEKSTLREFFLKAFPALPLAVIITLVPAGDILSQQQEPLPEKEPTLLKLLDLIPGEASIDFIQNKTQSQTHVLLTEQRHPKTWNFSDRVEEDLAAAVQMLLAVDEDIASRLDDLRETGQALRTAVRDVEEAVLSGGKIHVVGSGPSAVLAEQLANLWRSFWKEAESRKKTASRIRSSLGEGTADRLVARDSGLGDGEIDLQAGTQALLKAGRDRIEHWGFGPRDVVFFVSSSGEDPGVLAAALAVLEKRRTGSPSRPGSRSTLYFLYNNPEDQLLPFDRCRALLEKPGITRVNLSTGPQAIAGSTGMQALTVNTYVLGHLLQAAAERLLRRFLSPGDMKRLGFEEEQEIGKRLEGFSRILRELKKNTAPFSGLVSLAARTCGTGHRITAYVHRGLPAASLALTETGTKIRLSRGGGLFQMCPGKGAGRASPQPNAPPGKDDLGLLLVLSPEESLLKDKDSGFSTFFRLFDERGARIMPLFITAYGEKEIRKIARRIVNPGGDDRISPVAVQVTTRNDPFGINQTAALKMLLEAQAAVLQARAGIILGNTRIPAGDDSLRSVDRKTFLVLSHVNDVLDRPSWAKQYGIRKPISYGEANAVLFDSRKFIENERGEAVRGRDVALSIVRILESLRLKRTFTPEEAWDILTQKGLREYLRHVASGS